MINPYSDREYFFINYFKILSLGIFLVCSYLSISLDYKAYQNLNSKEQEQIKNLRKNFIYYVGMPFSIIFIVFLILGIIVEDSTSLSLELFSPLFGIFTSLIIVFVLLSFYRKLKQSELPKTYINSWLRATALILLGTIAAWLP